MARAALPLVLIPEKANANAAASGTDYAISPAPLDNVVHAILGITEVPDCFLECCKFGGHESILRQNLGFVKLIIALIRVRQAVLNAMGMAQWKYEEVAVDVAVITAKI